MFLDNSSLLLPKQCNSTITTIYNQHLEIPCNKNPLTLPLAIPQHNPIKQVPSLYENQLSAFRTYLIPNKKSEIVKSDPLQRKQADEIVLNQ